MQINDIEASTKRYDTIYLSYMFFRYCLAEPKQCGNLDIMPYLPFDLTPHWL